MTLSFATKGAHPIMSGAGDRTELLSWYAHLPVPDPDQLAAKRAELLAQIAEDKAKKQTTNKRPVIDLPTPKARTIRPPTTKAAA